MTRPVFVVSVVAVVVVFVVVSCGGSADRVRLATEGAYPPYNFVNDRGEVDGFERELGDELCRRAGLECVWVTDEWDSMIPSLVAGDYDTIITGISITEERERVIDFTQPYLPPSPSVYVALAGSGEAATDGRVAAQAATVQAGYVSQSGATLVEYPLVPDAIRAVLGGEADAALVERGFARDSITQSGGRLALVGPEVTLGSGTGTGIGIRQDDSQLKDKLDRAITTMKEDGTLNTLTTTRPGPDGQPVTETVKTVSPPDIKGALWWLERRLPALFGRRLEDAGSPDSTHDREKPRPVELLIVDPMTPQQAAAYEAQGEGLGRPEHAGTAAAAGG